MTAEHHARIPSHPNDITVPWLTDCLRQSGALPTGAIAGLATDLAAKWNHAEAAFLTIEYDGKAPAEAPCRLFVKIATHQDPLADIFPGEAAFYAEGLPASLPLAPCHGAFLDPGRGATCLLLEDLRRTHRAVEWPQPPSLPSCEAAVAALARLHGHWWHDTGPDTATFGRALRKNEERLADYFQDLLPGFFEHLGDRLSPERRRLVTAACARLPAVKSDRLTSGKPITRGHGDTHLWNFLYPKAPDRHGCVLLDWEDWRWDIGISDLAMMMALHWSRERRQRQEEILLQRYLEVLRCEVPTGYHWDDLRADYRLGHLQNVVVPIYQRQVGHAQSVWWPHLERWFLAFEDLECGRLL